MASLRTVFVGVYASNGIIRLLFLPLCYIALLSPFTLAVAWYFGFIQTLQSSIPEDFSWFDLLPALALSAVLVLLPTRLLSGSKDAGKSKDEGTRRVQSLPYWIPGVRHIWSIFFGGEEWLKRVRESSINSIVVYNAAGTKHNIIFSKTLLEQVDKSWGSLEEPKQSKWALLRNAFSVPKSIESQFFEQSREIAEAVETELFEGMQMEAVISSSLRILSESFPDFITFNSSIVDQMQWERVSNVELTDGTSEAECDLFMLVNEFCCNAILPPILGAQLTESYQLLATDLATFNQRFWALALGLPRLSPIQGLPGAALAQKRLLQHFTQLFRDLTNPAVRRVPDDDESVSVDETDADTSTPLTNLNELFTKYNFPLHLRAAISLQLVHGIVAEIVPLVFWTLMHIYSSSSYADAQSSDTNPLSKVKEETQTWALAIQPPSIHPSFPAPPELRFGPATVLTSQNTFPYLRSCINESRRLYSSSVAILEVMKPLSLAESGLAQGSEKEQWMVDIGSYVDIGLSKSLINSSPANFPAPTTFQPDRFETSPVPSSVVSAIDPSQSYKTALLIALIAGITQLWQITPAPKKTFFEHMQEARDEAAIGAAALSGEQKAAREEAKKEKEKVGKKVGKWVIPNPVDGAEVKIPKTDIRVRVRRREGLPTSNIVRRIG